MWGTCRAKCTLRLWYIEASRIATMDQAKAFSMREDMQSSCDVKSLCPWFMLYTLCHAEVRDIQCRLSGGTRCTASSSDFHDSTNSSYTACYSPSDLPIFARDRNPCVTSLRDAHTRSAFQITPLHSGMLLMDHLSSFALISAVASLVCASSPNSWELCSRGLSPMASAVAMSLLLGHVCVASCALGLDRHWDFRHQRLLAGRSSPRGKRESPE